MRPTLLPLALLAALVPAAPFGVLALAAALSGASLLLVVVNLPARGRVR